ncbi:hypothetical protein ACLOJK_028426 [Asimina triloba]
MGVMLVGDGAGGTMARGRRLVRGAGSGWRWRRIVLWKTLEGAADGRWLRALVEGRGVMGMGDGAWPLDLSWPSRSGHGCLVTRTALGFAGLLAGATDGCDGAASVRSTVKAGRWRVRLGVGSCTTATGLVHRWLGLDGKGALGSSLQRGVDGRTDLLACVGEEVDGRRGQLVGDELRRIAGRDGELLSLPEMALLVAHGKGAVASLANAADVIVGFLCCVAMLGLQMEEEICLGCL